MAAPTVTLRLEAYNQAARRLVTEAQGLADTRGHGEVEPLHLVYTLCDQNEAARAAIAQAGADPDDVLVEGEVCLRRLPKGPGGPAYLSPRTLDLLSRAEGEASRQGGVPVTPGHLLLAASQASGGDARIVLSACGISAPVLRAQLSQSEQGEDATTPDTARGERYAVDLTQRASQGRFDPKVGRDAELRRVVQVLARRGANNPLLVGEPGVGKHSIIQALCQRIATGDVPTLLQGKRVLEVDTTALLTGARSRSEVEGRLSRFLSGVRDSGGEVIAYFRDLETLLGDRGVPMARHLLASALRAGEIRALAVVDPATRRRYLAEGQELGRHFVAIEVPAPDEAGTVEILRALVTRFETAHGLAISDPALVAAARLSKRYLRGAQLPKSAVDLIDESAARLRVEVQSMPAELDHCQRRLEAVQVQLASLADDEDEASRATRAELESTRERLQTDRDGLRERWQRELAGIAQVSALKEELAALERELSELPRDSERAEELRAGSLRSLKTQLAEAEAALPGADALVRDTVGEADVAAVVAEWTGVPVARMLEGEAKKLLQMEQRLSQRVIGQVEAVAAISRAVRRSRAGLRDNRRPIGSFLFLGVSGVGKTELAKALAEFLFDDENALTRLDMSEFMEKHTVARLLGSPPGYADSEEGGFLTEAVRARPYSVLLFDEVEKAHPDVFNILLQVLDDGRLTDSRGRLSHFSDCVVIMTSNLGAHHILAQAARGEGPGGALQAQLDEALANHFRPEFLNRIDDIISFSVLDREDLGAILELQLGSLSRMLARRGLNLSVSDAAKAHLVELGYDPAFGARPLKRVLQRELQDPMSEALLGGDYPEGYILRVDLQDGELRFDARPVHDT